MDQNSHIHKEVPLQPVTHTHKVCTRLFLTLLAPKGAAGAGGVPGSACELCASVLFTAEDRGCFLYTGQQDKQWKMCWTTGKYHRQGGRGLPAPCASPGSLCKQDTCRIPGWVMPTQHNTHGLLPPRGTAEVEQKLQTHENQTADLSSCGLVVGSQHPWASGIYLLYLVCLKKHPDW